jgi:putative DNA primase/helicase
MVQQTTTTSPPDGNTSQASGGSTALPQVTFPSEARRPCFACYDQAFAVGNRRYKEGVYYHCMQERKDKDGNTTPVEVNLWICSVLKVLYIVRTDAGNEHSYLLEYVPHGESTLRRVVLPQALLLSGRGEEALKMLRDIGVSVLYSHAKLVREYLDREHLRFSVQTPDSFWRSVKVVGWGPEMDCFVLPTQIIGNGARVWFSGKADATLYRKNGDIIQWQTHVAKPCRGNSYLVFGLCCGFTGPLLEPLNIPGIGFHYFGESTIGKTTVLAVSSSPWGSSKFMLGWRSTVNGLEVQAINRSSILIVLDESHMIEPKALDASVYLLLNGKGKPRMNKDSTAKEIADWRLCLLCSGERSIETHLGRQDRPQSGPRGSDHRCPDCLRPVRPLH